MLSYGNKGKVVMTNRADLSQKHTTDIQANYLGIPQSHGNQIKREGRQHVNIIRG